MIYDKVNYTSDISYLNNIYIFEYDISKANINILFEKGLIDKNTYDYLYESPRMVRQVYVGKLQKENKEVVEGLKQGIIEAKQKLFESNNLTEYDILSIKNDAVFVINKQLKYTDFGMVKFLCKNIYTSFYKINNLEIYYYYDNMSKKEIIDIKGISDEVLIHHNDFMLQFIKDLLFTIQINGVDISIRMLKDFYLQYINYQLPVGYYREFNNRSMYHCKYKSYFNTGYYTYNMPDSNKEQIDITYNLSILIELQKILVSMYFNKYK